jgi:hypothetical protein
MTRNIDELNNLRRSVEPRKYFEEMGFTEEEIEERVEFTEKADSIFDVILVLILTSDYYTWDDLRDRLESEYLSLVIEYADIDDYLTQYVSDFSSNFINTTKDHDGEEWYTSSDRSLFNAENGANDVLNYQEYQEAYYWALDQIHKLESEEEWEPNIDFFYCNNLCGYRFNCPYVTQEVEKQDW